MNRDDFLKRFDSESTKRGYKKAFKKFDGYLNGIEKTEEEFLEHLQKCDKTNQYETLQEVINYLKNSGVSNPVVRNYFDNLFKYFLLSGVELDYTQKRIRLKFPRIIGKRFEGMDRDTIQKILESKYGSKKFKVYCRGLAGGGFRENELLRLEPRMILFNEFPPRVKVEGRIAKFGIYRETFLPKNTARLFKELITELDVKSDQTIFVKEWNERSLNDFEDVFREIRKREGLETPNRKRYQQNDITLHSFRAFFITIFTDHNKERFGHALSGHSKDLSVYFRKSMKQRQIEYLQVMPSLDFDYIKKEIEEIKSFEEPEELIQEFKRSAV